MVESGALIPLSNEELYGIDGGSTKAVAVVSGLLTIGFTIAAAATGSEWCSAAAATCGLVSAWCAIAPMI
jgi:hypothetical protein